ncbi:MAG: hypothetical protein SWH54_02755 [Thermodesulfobacteriota bacterium]|nr:hypothetical protein [Thermodesulfobacteriota bacterium]
MPNNSKSKTAKRVRQWTLLIISNRGKSITIKWFKTLAITIASVLLVAIAASAWLGFIYKNSSESNKMLRIDVKNLRHKINSLEHEKDILMARLILTESRVEENLSKTGGGVVSAKTTDQDSDTDQKELQPKNHISVSADNLIVYHQPDLNTLRVQYMLRNTGSKAHAVAGRSVVILKNKGDNDQKKWLVLPHVPLVSGKPTGKKGRYFSIFNLKTMKFRANDQTGPGQFNTATVYIFSSTGELILEKDFPIGIKFKTLPAPKKKKPSLLPVKKKTAPVLPPKQKKPEATPAVEKTPVATPLKEKKKPDTSLAGDKQTVAPSDEASNAEVSSSESDKKTPGQVESVEQTPSLKDTDESTKIIAE